jgi:hypothetical protein
MLLSVAANGGGYVSDLKVSDLFSVQGKVALVTGGSRGIGEMIAAGFLANGASVYISSRKADVCDATAERLASEYDGTCVSLPADLSTLAGVEALAREHALEIELGRCIAEFDALWALTKRNVSQSSRGTIGPGAMVMKLAYSEARQRFGELCLKALGRDALHVDDNELVEERLRTLALTIAAGASQIQRNIIGERVLDLPREPR